MRFFALTDFELRYRAERDKRRAERKRRNELKAISKASKKRNRS